MYAQAGSSDPVGLLGGKEAALAKKAFWWQLCLENKQDREKVGFPDGDLRCSM